MGEDEASEALQAFRYTAFVVGTQGNEGAHFMFANWGTQAGFDPWRFVVMVKAAARTLANIRSTGAATINLLDAAQRDVPAKVLSKGGDDKVDGAPGATEAPRLAGAHAGLDCRLVEVVDIGGDHAAVVLEPVDGWSDGDGPALTLPELDLSYAG